MHTHATTHAELHSTDHSPARIHAVAALAPYLHALLRIGAGLLFLQHGLQKLFGMFGGMGPQGGTVQLDSMFGLAGILEFAGGILLILGFLTRPVALILTVEMVSAFFIAHAPRGGMPIQNGGELPLLYALVWLALLGLGAGPLSVDAAIGRGRHRAESVSRLE
jgi:putative oxidoreductase